MSDTAQHSEPNTIEDQMYAIGHAARAAAAELAKATTKTKNAALAAAAGAFRASAQDIIAANEIDLAAARKTAMKDAFLDRLALDGARSRRSPRCPTRSANRSANGIAPMGCVSSASGCRSESSA